MDESVQKHIEEALPKVGRFQKFAEAMLRGCAQTSPIKFAAFDGRGGACALGALRIGLQEFTADGSALVHHKSMTPFDPMHAAYERQYFSEIAGDNDRGAFTREQIAARIAAL